MLMAYLDAASLLEAEILLVTVSRRRVRAIVSVLADLKSASSLGVHLTRSDASCGPITPPFSEQKLLVARTSSIIVVVKRVAIASASTTLPLQTIMVLVSEAVGCLSSALHAEVGLGREVSRTADTILSLALRVR